MPIDDYTGDAADASPNAATSPGKYIKLAVADFSNVVGQLQKAGSDNPLAPTPLTSYLRLGAVEDVTKAGKSLGAVGLITDMEGNPLHTDENAVFNPSYDPYATWNATSNPPADPATGGVPFPPGTTPTGQLDPTLLAALKAGGPAPLSPVAADNTGEDLASLVTGFADDTRSRGTPRMRVQTVTLPDGTVLKYSDKYKPGGNPQDPNFTAQGPQYGFPWVAPIPGAKAPGQFDAKNTSHTEDPVYTDISKPVPYPDDYRTLESSQIHTKGGWRDHTDGNRITTTRGDKVEVIRGNYKLVVLGRQDQTKPKLTGMDISGGVNVTDLSADASTDASPGANAYSSLFEWRQCASTARIAEVMNLAKKDPNYDKANAALAAASDKAKALQESLNTLTQATQALVDPFNAILNSITWAQNAGRLATTPTQLTLSSSALSTAKTKTLLTLEQAANPDIQQTFAVNQLAGVGAPGAPTVVPGTTPDNVDYLNGYATGWMMAAWYGATPAVPASGGNPAVPATPLAPATPPTPAVKPNNLTQYQAGYSDGRSCTTALAYKDTTAARAAANTLSAAGPNGDPNSTWWLAYVTYCAWSGTLDVTTPGAGGAPNANLAAIQAAYGKDNATGDAALLVLVQGVALDTAYKTLDAGAATAAETADVTATEAQAAAAAYSATAAANAAANPTDANKATAKSAAAAATKAATAKAQADWNEQQALAAATAAGAKAKGDVGALGTSAANALLAWTTANVGPPLAAGATAPPPAAASATTQAANVAMAYMKQLSLGPPPGLEQYTLTDQVAQAWAEVAYLQAIVNEIGPDILPLEKLQLFEDQAPTLLPGLEADYRSVSTTKKGGGPKVQVKFQGGGPNNVYAQTPEQTPGSAVTYALPISMGVSINETWSHQIYNYSGMGYYPTTAPQPWPPAPPKAMSQMAGTYSTNQPNAGDTNLAGAALPALDPPDRASTLKDAWPTVPQWVIYPVQKIVNKSHVVKQSSEVFAKQTVSVTAGLRSGRAADLTQVIKNVEQPERTYPSDVANINVQGVVDPNPNPGYVKESPGVTMYDRDLLVDPDMQFASVFPDPGTSPPSAADPPNAAALATWILGGNSLSCVRGYPPVEQVWTETHVHNQATIVRADTTVSDTVVTNSQNTMVHAGASTTNTTITGTQHTILHANYTQNDTTVGSSLSTTNVMGTQHTVLNANDSVTDTTLTGGQHQTVSALEIHQQSSSNFTTNVTTTNLALGLKGTILDIQAVLALFHLGINAGFTFDMTLGPHFTLGLLHCNVGTTKLDVDLTHTKMSLATFFL